MMKKKKKEPSVDPRQRIKHNGVQGGRSAFGQLVAPFIKKKNFFLKPQSDQHQGGPVKKHHAGPSANDLTLRISLQKWKAHLAG